MDIWAILPVRPLAEGKSRLASALNVEDRISLNYKLFKKTLSTSLELLPADRIIVVSRSADILDEARTAGAEGLTETGGDLNAALAQGADAARTRGAEAVLSLSSDLPFVRADDLRIMLAMVEDADVAIATDRHRSGTNALLMRPPLAIPYLHGEGSCAAHMAAAQAAGLRAIVIDRPGLARDLDTPDDLAELPSI